ncbi:type II CAAX endopeptidase family protein [Priestia abyssalis]|uniref:type II CAAX endopeptidase family protein n=1 Tax=Priestia abyssalis TaxID=1221450 RepID=UPI000994A740|nr:type II CAAX endopeptidase family protein [Priestia abyssalis]
MLLTKRIILMFLAIHFSFFVVFTSDQWFWILFPLLYIILIAVSMTVPLPRRMTIKQFIIGILSGLFLYGVFAFGYWLLIHTPLPIKEYVHDLYDSIGPSVCWQHALIWLIIAGEEFFWRSFIQKNVLGGFSTIKRILLATCLYTSVHLYSFNPLLILAAIAGGIYWGWLYEKTRNIYTIVASHAVFDLLLLYILPFT